MGNDQPVEYLVRLQKMWQLSYHLLEPCSHTHTHSLLSVFCCSDSESLWLWDALVSTRVSRCPSMRSLLVWKVQGRCLTHSTMCCPHGVDRADKEIKLRQSSLSAKAPALVGLCTLLVSETALVHYTPRPKGITTSMPEPANAVDEKCLGGWIEQNAKPIEGFGAGQWLSKGTSVTAKQRQHVCISICICR